MRAGAVIYDGYYLEWIVVLGLVYVVRGCRGLGPRLIGLALLGDLILDWLLRRFVRASLRKPRLFYCRFAAFFLDSRGLRPRDVVGVLILYLGVLCGFFLLLAVVPGGTVFKAPGTGTTVRALNSLIEAT